MKNKRRTFWHIIFLLMMVYTFPVQLCGATAWDDYFDKGYKVTNPDEKIKYFTKALENWTESNGINNKANTHINRGLAYYKKSDYDQAIRDFNKAITLNPKFEGSRQKNAF